MKIIPLPPTFPRIVRDDKGYIVNQEEVRLAADDFLEWAERFPTKANALVDDLNMTRS